MKYILLIIVVIISFMAGNFVGVHHYKSSCEVLGYTKPEWRECKL